MNFIFSSERTSCHLFSFSFICSLLVENENNIIACASLIQLDILLICVILEGKIIVVITAANEAKNNGVNVIDVTSKYNLNLSKYIDNISYLLPLIY
jgi:DNA-binding MurR/RpiR family transcriptional regulator